MQIFLNFFIFIFGLAIGSFLNCVIYRLEKSKSFLMGRSYCPYCKHSLNWYDLIPILSFLLLRGKCRYCQKPISLQYSLVELVTGILFVLIFNFQFSIFNFQSLLNLCFLFAIFSLLIIIFVYDLKHYIIPNKIIYFLIGITFLYQLFNILNLDIVLDSGFRAWDFRPLVNSILSAFLVSGFFLAIVLGSSGRAMGMGDVKLGFFIGLFLGFPKILVSLFLSFLIGAIIGIGLVLLKRKTLKSEIPFGPFLILGVFIAFFWGKEIIQWFLI